jgi:uncharacterized sulfatase
LNATSAYTYLYLFIKRVLLAYVILLLCRLLFIAFNFKAFALQKTSDLLWSLLVGIRFDTTALLYFTGPALLLMLMPGNFKRNTYYQLLVKILFITALVLLLALNLIDVAYYPFSGKRSGMELWSIQYDLWHLLFDYVVTYWYLFLLLILLVWLCVIFYPENPPLKNLPQMKIQIVIFTLFTPLLILLARGSFGLKPLNSSDAVRLVQPQLVAVALNTPFQMLMTVGQKPAETLTFFSDEAADKLFNPIKQTTVQDSSKPNFVLIIVESLSAEYVGFLNNGVGFTPFLDSLAKHSVVYTNAFANGKRSVEALPAIWASMPSLLHTDYTSGGYAQNKLNGLGNYLLPLGYDVSFYHGGRNGTMGFDNFILQTGGKYFGLNQYPNANKDYDGKWGISDFSYLDYFANELSQKPLPFLSAVFTLSSHHPYKIPKDNRLTQFKSGTHPIHATIQYTDDALRNFFNKAQQQPWFNNTIFIITADHSADNQLPKYQTMHGKFRIPLLIYNKKSGCKEIKTTTQHVNIMPYILEHAGVKSYFSFGNAVADSNHFAIQFTDERFQLVKMPWVYHFNGKEGIALYNSEKDTLLKQNLLNKNGVQPALDSLIKAYLQQYTVRLNANKTTLD